MKLRVHRTPLIGLTLLLVSLLSIPDLAAYIYTYPYTPPYTYPPSSIITVHTTTIVFSGPPSMSFSLDVAALDSLALLTQLRFSVSSPLSSFVIQIFQLNTIPLTITNPSGRTLIVFQFNISPDVEKNITTAEFYVRVPQLELIQFGVPSDTLQVQRLVFPPSHGIWTPVTTFVNSTDVNYLYLGAVSAGLSLFAITGLQSRGVSPFTFVTLLITVAASGIFLFSVRRNRGRSYLGGR